jgi:hypothetical protein
MRRALALAIERGEGRTAAVLHGNLASAIYQYEGLQTAIAAADEGIAFAEGRGITEMAKAIAWNTIYLRAESGQPEPALAELGSLADDLEAAGDVTFIWARSDQLHLLAERGSLEDAHAPDELLARARESGEPQLIRPALAAAARVHLAQGRTERARELLSELEQVPGIGAELGYVALLPGLVRSTLALGDPELAARLVEGFEPTVPQKEHALASARALLAEAAGDADAADLYAEAAERWRTFGNVPEHAYALLGQGRCLAAVGDPAAQAPLREAHKLFASVGYVPALAETEALLGESEAAAV